MRPFLAALQFLTRLPCPGFVSSETDRRRAPYYFAAAGLLIGALLAALEWSLRPRIPLFPRIALVLAANLWITGGLHFDGLADTFDALAGPPRRALEIMRDSRIGAMGTLALIATLGLQAAALVSLAPRPLSAALLLAPAWGRAGLVVSALAAPAARPDGLAAAFRLHLRPRHAIACCATAAAAALALHSLRSLATALAALALAFLLGAAFRRRFSGHTGDTLGTVNQAIETATYWLFLGAH